MFFWQRLDAVTLQGDIISLGLADGRGVLSAMKWAGLPSLGLARYIAGKTSLGGELLENSRHAAIRMPIRISDGRVVIMKHGIDVPIGEAIADEQDIGFAERAWSGKASDESGKE